MLRKLRLVGLLIAFGTTLCSSQMTWAAEFSRQAKSGQATRIYNFYNCVGHHPGRDGGAFAEHGTVTIKDVTQNRCWNANEPARETWYTSAAGFKGVDKVVFPQPGSRRQVTEQ